MLNASENSTVIIGNLVQTLQGKTTSNKTKTNNNAGLTPEIKKERERLIIEFLNFAVTRTTINGESVHIVIDQAAEIPFRMAAEFCADYLIILKQRKRGVIYPRPRNPFLYGPTGTGKTILAKLIRAFVETKTRIPRERFAYHTEAEILDYFRRNGEKTRLEDRNLIVDEYLFNGQRDKDGRFIPEIVNNYKNSFSIEDWNKQRSDDEKEFGLFTVFTSNLIPEDIEASLKPAVYSRLAETVNFIPYIGKDRRQTTSGD